MKTSCELPRTETGGARVPSQVAATGAECPLPLAGEIQFVPLPALPSRTEPSTCCMARATLAFPPARCRLMKSKGHPSASPAKGGGRQAKMGAAAGEKTPFTTQPAACLGRQPVSLGCHPLLTCSPLLGFQPRACAGCRCAGTTRGHRNGRSRAAGSGTRCGRWRSGGCSDIPVPGSRVVPRSRDGGALGAGTEGLWEQWPSAEPRPWW